MLWIEAKQNERKIGRVDGPQPDSKKNQQWVAKYGSLADILAEYDPPEPEPLPMDMDEIAALVAEMTDTVEPEF